MLGRLFGSRPFLDADVEAWHLETWAWLIDHFASEVPLKSTPLVLANADFFPASDATGHARALHVFDCVKRIMHIEDWPCTLEAQSRRTAGHRVAEFVAVAGGDDPNGTFRIEEGGEVIITYAPDLLDRPVELVATLAHELAHYLLAHENDLDEETHELITDLTVAYTGLGLFGANAAFSFSQHGDAFSQGWSSKRSGYLSPPSWAFALAVFAQLTDDNRDYRPWLSAEVAGPWRAAMKYLGKSPEILAPLRAKIAG